MSFGSYGKQIKTSGLLHEMLDKPNLTPEELFKIVNIEGDISQNIQTFLRFCLKNKEFTTKMIKICFNSTYQELKSDDQKRVPSYLIEPLLSDPNALSAFIFGKEQENWGLTKVSQPEQQAINSTNTVDKEVEDLFAEDIPIIEAGKWEGQKDSFQKYELLKMFLAHLQQKDSNPTCMGYIHKFCDCLIKKSSDQFLTFLQQNSQYLKLFTKNIKHPSIAAIIVLFLNCEDQKKEYKHEIFKQQLIKYLIDFSFQIIENFQVFETYLMIIEEILNTMKQSYYEYFDDFKRCAHELVKAQTLQRYYQALYGGEASFCNGARYLENLIKRINSEFQQPDYYRSGTESFTMAFQHQFFYSKFDQLINLIDGSKKYNSIYRLYYLGFFMSLLKNMQRAGEEPNLTYVEMFKRIIVFYEMEQSGGLVKNYLFQLLKFIIRKFKQDDTQHIAAWLLEKKIEHMLLEGVELTPDQKSSVCFIRSILFEVEKKQQSFLDNYSKQNKLQLGEIYYNFQTKLGRFTAEDQSPFQGINFQSFQLAVDNRIGDFIPQDNNPNKPQEKKVDEIDQKEFKIPEIPIVGKPNIIVPTLNLPNKTENTSRVAYEQVQVKQEEPDRNWKNSDILQDLKSTKFTKYDAFIEKKNRQKKGKQQILQTSPNQQKGDTKNLPTLELKPESPEVKTIPQSSTSNIPTQGERDYYAKYSSLI